MKRQLLLLSALLCFLTGVFAQTSGSVLGSVGDATGGAIVDAKVSVKNLATGFVNASATGPDGRFRIPQLPAGIMNSRSRPPASRSTCRDRSCCN